MNRFRITPGGIAVAVAAAALLMVSPATHADDDARPVDVQQQQPTVYRSAPVTPHVFNGSVLDLPSARQWKPGDPIREVPRRAYVDPTKGPAPIVPENRLDPLYWKQFETNRGVNDGFFAVPLVNVDAQPFTGANPPDTSGDVGANHFIQMVNGGGSTVRIYDKQFPTPNLLATFELEDLGGTGSCASGLGDPIPIYDRDADRWWLTEFSSGGNNLCFYVSQTSDPVNGGWFAYGFAKPSFPDYPKYGVWSTDANGGAGSFIATSNETSSAIYAYDRGKMLNGEPTTFQRFTIADLPGFSFNAVTPADHDGIDPPK